MNKTTQPFYLSSISNAMKGEAAMKKQTTMRGMKKKDVMEFVCNVKTAGPATNTMSESLVTSRIHFKRRAPY